MDIFKYETFVADGCANDGEQTVDNDSVLRNLKIELFFAHLYTSQKQTKNPKSFLRDILLETVNPFQFKMAQVNNI